VLKKLTRIKTINAHTQIYVNLLNSVKQKF